MYSHHIYLHHPFLSFSTLLLVSSPTTVMSYYYYYLGLDSEYEWEHEVSVFLSLAYLAQLSALLLMQDRMSMCICEGVILLQSDIVTCSNVSITTLLVVSKS
jgi:hypothetical protein